MAAANRFLPFEELHQVFFADVGGGSTITLCAVDTDLDQVIQGFKLVIEILPSVHKIAIFFPSSVLLGD